MSSLYNPVLIDHTPCPSPSRSQRLYTYVLTSPPCLPPCSLRPQHYNMVMAAAAAASASTSEDHDLLLNRFLPYGSSQMFLEQPSTPGSSTLAATNGGSNSGSTSSLVSSGSLRERDKDRERDRDRDNHSISGMSRSSAEAAAAAMYGSISDVISLD